MIAAARTHDGECPSSGESPGWATTTTTVANMNRVIGPPAGSIRIQPSPLLRDYVRCYDFIAALQQEGATHPVTARVYPRLAFALDTPLRAFEYGSNAARILPLVTVTGPLTNRVAHLSAVGSSARIFSITFEPAGFFRLFQIPPGVILNFAHSAADVLGPDMEILQEKLCEASIVKEMVNIVEQMLLRRLQAATEPVGWVRQVSEALQQSQGKADFQQVRTSIGLSERQIRRHFINQTGLTPKSFSQVLRFNNALNLKRRFPDRLWTRICVDAGYYDQSHMHAEFVELGGEAPSRLLHSLSVAPALMPP